MKFIEQIQRLKYLDELIKKKATGTPEELAGRLGISRSQLYNLTGYFNDMGMEIGYSRRLKSFYYKNNTHDLQIMFSIKIISDQTTHKIVGGSFTFSYDQSKTNGYDYFSFYLSS